MIGKIVNKVMKTVPAVVGTVTELVQSLLGGSKKDEAPSRPPVQPRKRAAATPSRATSAPAAEKCPVMGDEESAPKKARTKSKSSTPKSKPAASKSKPAKKSEESSEKSLDEMTYKELYSVAQDLDITGRKAMRKAELLEAIKAEKS